MLFEGKGFAYCQNLPPGGGLPTSWTSSGAFRFNIFDVNGSGEVSIEEFISGILRLKGSASAKDMSAGDGETLGFDVMHNV